MADYMESLALLTEQFRRLPGVGRRSATRMAFSILDMSEEDVAAFATTILEAKARIHPCPICGNLTDRELCSICTDPERDTSVICVVEDARTLLAMEKVRDYRGTYHVLGGLISPMKGMNPESINLRSLIERVGGANEAREESASEGGAVKEVILALGATVEGDATSMYIAKLLAPFSVRVTRLAYGIPVGSELEYADEVTLYRALQGRTGI
ncbi:MAG: recombination protein RecR [Clostridia bacterium]|nr:recombination protein RecR [Clostridia bacterium]